MHKGQLFVITGPSAVGKTTLTKRLLAMVPGAVRLCTATTRAPRPGEVDGKDYFFLREEQFLRRCDAGDFLEWVQTYDHYYGSLREELEVVRERHPVVFAVVDPRGARSIVKEIPAARVIFLKPGSVDDLRRRLRERGGEDAQEEFDRRLAEVERELEAAGDFHHVVINKEGETEETTQKLLAIIHRYVS